MPKKIIGIGNAITDILCKVEESYIQQLALNKGAMSLIDESFLERFQLLTFDKLCSGGSAGNTIATLAQLGNPVDFIGNVANDFAGKSFINDIKQYGANYIGSIDNDPHAKSASSYILITPDAERTMCTFLGCASNLHPDNFNDNFFHNAEILYIEGYLWDSPATIEAIKYAINLAKKHGTKIAFSLSDAFCVQRHRQDFIQLVSKVDILFANEVEITQLLELDNFNSSQIVKLISALNSRAVIGITRSEKGCAIINANQIDLIPCQIINNIIDTTGAGDNFASGFLHNLVRNKNLLECATYGNYLAGKIIQKIGARFNSSELDPSNHP